MDKEDREDDGVEGQDKGSVVISHGRTTPIIKLALTHL